MDNFDNIIPPPEEFNDVILPPEQFRDENNSNQSDVQNQNGQNGQNEQIAVQQTNHSITIIIVINILIWKITLDSIFHLCLFINSINKQTLKEIILRGKATVQETNS